MSVIVGSESSEVEKRVKLVNRELEAQITSKMTYMDKVRLARQKMSEIKKACIEKPQNETGDAEQRVYLPDFDDLRKGMRSKVIKNTKLEQANSKCVTEQSSPMPKQSMCRPSKVRFSTLKDISPANSNKKSKQRKQKEDPKKMSMFNNKTHTLSCTEEEKKRNSAIVQSFGQRLFGEANALDVPKKPTFGIDLKVPDYSGNVAPRDSIDCLSANQSGRPSTWVQMRNSMFKFDTSLLVNDCFKETDQNIDEIVSDLSDCELDFDLIDGEEEREEQKTAEALKVQVLQVDDKFLHSSKQYCVNTASCFDEEKQHSTKFAQRVKIFDGFQSDISACLLVMDDKLNRDKFTFLDDCTYDLFINPQEEVKVDTNTLQIDKLVQKTEEPTESAHQELIKHISTGSLGCCYSNLNTPGILMSMTAGSNSVYALNLYSDFVHKHFTRSPLLEIVSEKDRGLLLMTKTDPVFMGYEFTRQRSPISLTPGDEFYFNKVDGIRVEGVLPSGFSQDDFEAFKPQSNNWDIDILNRHLSDYDIYRYLLSASMKLSNPELVEKALRECLDCPKNMSRISKLKKEYLVKLAKKSKQAILKLSVVRHYHSLGIKKKISEILLFYSDPKEHEALEEADQKTSLKEQLKQVFLSKKNLIHVGKTLQTKLPKLRNEFERSSLLFALDIDFDLELGYSKEKGAFFIRIEEEFEEPSDEYEAVEGLQPVNKEDFTKLVGDFLPQYKLNEPREGIWIPMKPESSIRIPDKALLIYDTTVVRVHSETVNLI